MTFRDIAAGLRRRWYIVLIGGALTVGLCAFAVMQVPPTVQIGATVLLVPGEASVPAGGNAFLYLGGLGQARDVLLRALSSDERARTVVEGSDGTVDYVADPTSSGPIVMVSARGPSEPAARELRDRAIVAVRRTLDGLQDEVDVPPDARASVLVLSSDSTGASDLKQTTRIVGALAAAGVVVTALLTALVDGLLLTRSAARRSDGQRIRTGGQDDVRKRRT